MRRILALRTALVLAAALTLGAGEAFAVRPITPPAPEFPPGLAWINSVAFSLKKLRNRRVVMVTFLNAMTTASIRTYPQLNRLWDKYNQEGLMIIGVHSPDYDFDRDPVVVRDLIATHKLRFPIVIDSRREIWKAYRNEGWPAHYLISHKGLIVHDRLGGSGYAEFEDEILLALRSFNGFRPDKNYRIPPDSVRKECGKATAGFYLGKRRGKKVKKIRPNKYKAVVASRDGEVAVLGRWSAEPDALRAKEGDDGLKPTTRLLLIYRGAEIMAVLTRTGPKPARLFIKQNEQWLHTGNGHDDIEWDDDDRSFVLIDKPRLYKLAKNKKKGMKEAIFYPGEAGIGVASFEFSDKCQAGAGKKKK